VANPDALEWREKAAVADMHCRLAAKKLNAVMTKDTRDHQGQLGELAKAIECIEAAHDAAMTAYDTYANMIRATKTVRGVKLTSIKQGPLRVAIGDALTAPEKP
jgi:hypothetical protein